MMWWGPGHLLDIASEEEQPDTEGQKIASGKEDRRKTSTNLQIYYLLK